MKVITAVEDYTPTEKDVCVFLAGGITNCWEWQDAVIKELQKKEGLDDLVIFNPRRKNFPIGNPDASKEQIEWEFKWLERMDIFSMYFTGGDSDQPICMYELGRNILRMQMRFPVSWVQRLVITCEEGYRRKDDVCIQTELATGSSFARVVNKYSIREHVSQIRGRYWILKKRYGDNPI